MESGIQHKRLFLAELSAEATAPGVELKQENPLKPILGLKPGSQVAVYCDFIHIRTQ